MWASGVGGKRGELRSFSVVVGDRFLAKKRDGKTVPRIVCLLRQACLTQAGSE